MTPEERREVAIKAAAARWKNEIAVIKKETKPLSPDMTTVHEMPYSMFQGEVTIGEVKMACHVLNDGKHVLAQREMVKVISAAGRESGDLQAYISNIPIDTSNLDLGANFVKFRVPGTQFISHGYQATFLVDICSAYLEARERRLLKSHQLPMAKRAEIVLRACAKVGIEALIDEATGYDKFKKKREYQLKLQAFIAEDMQEWVKTFPDDFWFELARLEGIRYSPRYRPIRWGKYVMAFIYDAIDKDLGKKLREINLEPEKGRNHHQWLAGYGKERIHDFEAVVMTILPGGTQVQKNWLCRMFGREAVAQVVRRWRGSFLNSKSQLHEWVSRSTARKWVRENPELYAWSQSR